MQHASLMMAIGVGALSLNPPTAPKVYDASIPREQQMALAMSAAPEPVSSNATIYVLGPRGYEKAREGTNGFSCFVFRSFVSATETTVGPMCLDAEGSRTSLVVYLHMEELRSSGKSEAEITADADSGYQTGRFQHPSKMGLLYMMSTENRLGPTKDHTTQHFPPHVMIYAPNMTAQDLGFASASQLADVPYMGLSKPGTPGNLLVVVPQ
jgi:hypothetical protein